MSLAVACTDAPTDSPAELAAPQFKKKTDPGPPRAADAFPTIVRFRPVTTDNIRSDDELRSDAQYSGPDYVDGVCGVRADLGNFEDARMDPDANYRGKHRKTCGDPRVLIIERDQAADKGPALESIVDGVFSNIDKVLAVKGTDEEPRMGQFNAFNGGCGRLIFNPLDSEGAGSDSLLVRFDNKGTAEVADDVWTVRTQDYPYDKARCSEDGRLWHMPFQMTIERQ